VIAYTVTVRQRRLPDARTRRVAWIPWGGVRKAQAGHGRDLQGPDLDPPMAMITGAVHDRDLAPRQSGQLGVQGWLVGLDQQVVGAAVDEEAGVVALGVQRVGGRPPRPPARRLDLPGRRPGRRGEPRQVHDRFHDGLRLRWERAGNGQQGRSTPARGGRLP
jgi:hypothetical protein